MRTLIYRVCANIKVRDNNIRKNYWSRTFYENFIEESTACSPIIIYIYIYVQLAKHQAEVVATPHFCTCSHQNHECNWNVGTSILPDLSCHIWEELRELLSFHCLLQQILQCQSEGKCSQSTVDTSLVMFDPIYLIRNIQCARVHSLLCVINII